MFKSYSKLISLLMSIVLIVTSFSFCFTAQAKSASQLRSEKEKIQQEIDAAQDKLNNLSAQKRETEEYLATLRSKISLLQDKIDSLEDEKYALQQEIDSVQAKIDKTVEQLDKTQKEIDRKQKEFDESYELYCQRLRAMYVSGSVSNLEVLLTCTDMSTMLTRSQMINSVSKQDSQALDDLMKTMEEIEAKKKDLEIKRLELKEDKKVLDEDKKELQSRINEINSSKSELDSEAAECNALMKKLASQSSEYMEMIETDREQIAQIESDIRAALSNSSYNGGISSGSGSGALGYPTDSRTISAGYPYYSSGGWHGGIDFPVSTGSNIYAAGDGVVVMVKYLNYSYGYHILIDHGNGLSTLYAHNSQILVSARQHVSRGQIIAKSGSTGNSTGPHCHFEVRVNGSQVNPLSYL